MTVINLSAERLRRERFVIALAGAIHETVFADPEDPAPLAFDIAELAGELRRLPAAEIEHDYRAVLAWIAAGAGSLPDPHSHGLVDHHAEALAWANRVISATRSEFGLPALVRGRA